MGYEKVLVMKPGVARQALRAATLRLAKTPDSAAVIEAIANKAAVARVKISDIGPVPFRDGAGHLWL